MARRSDDKGLLEVWQEAFGENEDPLRLMVEHMLQRFLEAEMTEFIGAEPGERTEERTGYRNGHRRRTLTTRVGRA